MAEYLNPIISGILAGLVICILIGPVFFVLLQTSLKRGFKSAVFFALGIALSDTMFAALAYLGVSSLFNPQKMKEWMTIGGGIFMLAYGVFMFFKKKPQGDFSPRESSTQPLRNIISGWFFNTINPALLFYWLVVVTTVTARYEGNGNRIFIFLLCCMMVIFGTDVLKAYLANKLKNLVTDVVLHRINQGSGIILGCAGARLLFYAIR